MRHCLGLAALEGIVGMERSQLCHAALADSLRRLGRAAEAAGSWDSVRHRGKGPFPYADTGVVITPQG